MELTAVQQDALVEVINIGFGRAAASLSKLTGQRVQLEVPSITMCPVDELSDRLRPVIQGDVASIHQIFSGSVVGDALLVIDRQMGRRYARRRDCQHQRPHVAGHFRTRAQ